MGKLFTLAVVAVLAACGRPEPEPVEYWDCADMEIAAFRADGQVQLHLPGFRETLAPGERSGHYGSGQIRIAFERDGAELTIAGTAYACEPKDWGASWQRARDRGVVFRAIGQEPGWHLEVVPGGDLALVLDYGERTLTLPAPELDILDDSARGYQGQAGDRLVLVVIEDRVCFDIMSGEVFPVTVTVGVDDERYRGCGMPLRPLI